MSIRASYEINISPSTAPEERYPVAAIATIRDDGYVTSFEIFHQKVYQLSFHSLDEIEKLVNVLVELIVEARGIDNGSLFNK